MQSLADLTRSWSDTLSALSVGSLTIFLLPQVGRLDSNGNPVFHLHEFAEYFNLFEQLTSVAAVFLGIIVLSILMTIGYFVIQFGELVSISAEWRDKGSRAKVRLAKCSENPALMAMFANCYTSFRLLCGVGGLLILSSINQLFVAVTTLNFLLGVFSLTIAFFGWLLAARFARYSFAHLDWILFGDLKE
jgi:hypothetical protein